MSLIRLENAQLSYGLQVLLDGVDLNIEKGRRLCLIGRNGAGKSSLLKVLSGDVDLDGGTLSHAPELQIARLAQDLPEANGRSVFDVVAAGLGEVGALLEEFHTLSHGGGADDMERLSELQQRIEAVDGWQFQQKVDTTLTRLGLDGDWFMDNLSGGWRRRVALAQALVSSPDVLLLDEPTNHLDIAAIEWLEQQLLQFQGALVFITHDRSLLQKLATDIAELDRGFLRTWSGTYDRFLEYREQVLEEEARHNALFDKKLAQEETWIRQGIKARRTRNEGRVRELKAMREDRRQRREQQGKASFSVSSGERSGKLVAELEKVSYGFPDKQIVQDFTSVIMRGDRIGLIGANGAGKSTLLKLILGELEPQQGRARLGTQLQVAYFDQLREQLNLNQSAVDNIAEGREFIELNGKSRHIISYLSDFLFTGERARTPLRALSGGERNRVLLAKLFSKPANLLVMDEPTNDLDVETLELLEDLLTDYDGTVLLVSHDRAFLNNIVTSVIAFEGRGQVREYVGGYDDWLRQGGRWTDEGEAPGAAWSSGGAAEATATTATPGSTSDKKSRKPKKLSYKLQREFEQLPEKIEQLESELEALQQKAADPEFYAGPAEAVDDHLKQLAEKEQALESCFERWAELEDMQEG
ncbi:ATP-binding cassette domain-containing protein [Marinimicrobium sp. C2-29]|uniref:ATP-binding cassette domain-containing protein n=1 Tax=Marinimicrobium sp. C2-29 TaxID=3139825 RepID=UPI003138C172